MMAPFSARPRRPAAGLWLVWPVLLVCATACQQPLHHGLPEGEANEILSVLEQAGIGARKRIQEGSDPPRFSVSVAQSDSTRALAILQGRGLPRGTRPGLGQVYGQPSLIPTATEESARYLAALTGELERTLETVEGVVTSRVHLVLEQRDPFTTNEKPRNPARAAVLLKVRTGVAPLGLDDVQRLVAGSVPGLDPADVTVVLTPAPDAPAESATLVAMGPLRLAPGSRAVMLGGFVVVALVLGGLALLLLRTVRKMAVLERQVNVQAAEIAGPPDAPR